MTYMRVPKEKIAGAFGRFVKRFRVPLLLIAVLLAGYWLGGLGEAPAEHEHDETAVKADAGPQIWTCSMHPEVQLLKPGLCPKCNMPLIPLAQDDAGGGGMRRLTVSEAAKKLMDIEVAPVERKFVDAVVRMVGKVDYDETSLVYITAWIPGRLDRLYVDYTGVPVNKGDHMVYLYSPELIGAQEELLQAYQAVKNISRSESDMMRRMTEATAKAAREKLYLLGLTEEQIAEIEQTGLVSDHMTIYAPSGGIVIHKSALEGMYVETGTKIYTIADLSEVWVKLDAYESDLEWLRYGQDVEFTTVSYPGQLFKGTISFIDPILNERTRTVKIRVNVQNPDGRLKPGMFVKAVVRSQVAKGGRIMDARLIGKWICPMHPEIIKENSGKCDICEMPLVTTESLGYVSDDPDLAEKPLVIPATAALWTGTRAIVYVRVPDTEKPTFEGREIVLGPRAGDYYLVRRGLKEGELVVVKGQFKIDSSLQIMAKPSMMTPEGAAGAAQHAVELPALSMYQIETVLAKAEAVKEAVDSEDITGIRAAFAEFDQAIESVDMELLTGHPHMLWMEYRMRLGNDAVEGMEAKTLKEAKAAAKSLTENVSFMKAKFGLVRKHSDQPKSSISDDFRIQLAKVFDGYFKAQQALSDDNVQLAAGSANEALSSLKAVDMSLLAGRNHDIWMTAATELDRILTGSADNGDIKSFRESFHLLSQQMAKVAKHFGSTSQGPFYILNCPMAFDNTGADWLQDNKETRNPYFGEMMLQCGGVKEVIGVKEIWKKNDK